MSGAEFDYVVVGSGAGGGTAAARLAERGASVVVLEAGGDPCDNLRYDYQVPAFHALECENSAVEWDFFVRHYAGDDAPRVLYPRAGTLGGCTVHNAMIFVSPHNEDWQSIADLTGDASWRPENMRRYFMRVERCSYRPVQRLLNVLGINPSRHGFGGWLNVELPNLTPSAVADALSELWTELAREFTMDPDKLRKLRWLAEAGLDANDWRLVCEDSVGLRSTPLSTRKHRRTGTRERLLDVQRRHRDRLAIQLNALATRVLFDGETRAVGVEYLQGEGQYRAGKPGSANGVLRSVKARREVILAGGAFNTPQLLMLSGIGPAEHLRSVGIDVRVALDGVGSNLQDRYELGVVSRMQHLWEFFDNATFSPGDPQFREWNTAAPSGAYTSNGAILSLVKKSSVAQGPPDLFCMLLAAPFKGYYPGWAREMLSHLDRMTWVVLKAHTRNRAGTVRLRSQDPRDIPDIEFNYFADGGDQDLQAMVEGVRYVRALNATLAGEHAIVEEIPGTDIDTDEKLREFIRKNAWGHHASCTCAIGNPTEGGVVSSDFRVHGADGLRVVDASVFPKIPGFFIAGATYTIAEKAADVILAAHK